jgi:3-phenylpropionate/trans-cinnamate dioxygenase ferredoxin subunit
MTVSEWVRVADAAEIAPDTGHYVEVDDVPVAVWNVGGVYYATQDTCTHEEALLSEGDLWGEVIECPLHGAQFDVRTGEVLSLPALFPLDTYAVKVEDGVVYVGKTAE